MTDKEAILLLKEYFNGKRIMARYVSAALMVVSCSLPENITVEELKEFVLNNKRLWEK